MPLVLASGPKLHGWSPPVQESPFELGVWTNITPPLVDLDNTYGTAFVAIAPSAPGTLYLTSDSNGLWRTADLGSTWVQRTGVDNPTCVAVDPADPDHIYVSQGVNGSTVGFYVSTDGGANFTMPAGFASIAVSTTTNDVTTMVVDPADFDHILLGSHSPWQGGVVGGVMESTDGGETWTAHAAHPDWPGGSFGIEFITSTTWIVMTDGFSDPTPTGVWRTTNSGTSWTKVSPYGSVHHGCRMWRDSNDRLWIGGQPYPQYSDDDGVTWTQATSGLTSSTYYAVRGDGTTLYTQIANTGTNGGSPQPFMTTSESSPGTWSAYAGGAQTFIDGPYNMEFDAVNHVMYAACWKAGLQALRVA